jgi:hypothetical protein
MASSVNDGLTVPNHSMRLSQLVPDEVWASILSHSISERETLRAVIRAKRAASTEVLRLYWSLTKTGSLKDYELGKKSTIPPELVDALRILIESITHRLDVCTPWQIEPHWSTVPVVDMPPMNAFEVDIPIPPLKGRFA